ncbi:uncharacterized protein BKCO1_4700073 [Diplodia corticola]|uniref:DUF6594 domain-containing protein n=1 Tax=Diplodia corticola TaxID=236234 RepID=A0A1J9RVM9_9PEZI|nr:uncharacterized protein BKCO1_4700073 [Diplodia corticola]OJD31549.1 hypothetical protein BKCO1_4700073 [Diplodia corticola]
MEANPDLELHHLSLPNPERGGRPDTTAPANAKATTSTDNIHREAPFIRPDLKTPPSQVPQAAPNSAHDDTALLPAGVARRASQPSADPRASPDVEAVRPPLPPPPPLAGAGGSNNDPPAGYPSLAVHMASMPQASIFRSFTTLNILNLLYMQAELVSLEDELRRYRLDDANADSGTNGEHKSAKDRRKYATDWAFLRRSTSAEDLREAQAEREAQGLQGSRASAHLLQWRTMEDIRERLRRYNEAIVQTMKILSASEPSQHDLRDVQEYLRSEEMLAGGGLTGKDRTVWGCLVKNSQCQPSEDLITLLPRPESDHLTKFVINKVVANLQNRRKQWRWLRKMEGANGIAMLDDKTIYRWTFMLTSGLASMLPVVSMVALQQVEATSVRGLSLGLIALFNFVLAVLLTWFTSVRRVEVFAVSAAFAAVNVVFVTKSS